MGKILGMHVIVIDLDDDEYNALQDQAKLAEIPVADLVKNIVVSEAQAIVRRKEDTEAMF